MRTSHGVSELRQRRDESRLRPADQGREHAAVSAPQEVPRMRNVVHVSGKSDSRRPAGTDPTSEETPQDCKEGRNSMTTEQPDVLLRLRPRRGVDVNARLRGLLKALVRHHGMTCLAVADVPAETPITATRTKESESCQPRPRPIARPVSSPSPNPLPDGGDTPASTAGGG